MHGATIKITMFSSVTVRHPIFHMRRKTGNIHYHEQFAVNPHTFVTTLHIHHCCTTHNWSKSH